MSVFDLNNATIVAKIRRLSSYDGAYYLEEIANIHKNDLISMQFTDDVKEIGTIEANFKMNDVFDEMRSTFRFQDFFIEVICNDETTITGAISDPPDPNNIKLNPSYIITDFEKTISDDLTFKITGQDWKYVEKYKLMEYNHHFDSATEVPVDTATGQINNPTNQFRKITLDVQTRKEIFQNAYENNIINPMGFTDGTLNSPETEELRSASRKVNGLSNLTSPAGHYVIDPVESGTLYNIRQDGRINILEYFNNFWERVESAGFKNGVSTKMFYVDGPHEGEYIFTILHIFGKVVNLNPTSNPIQISNVSWQMSKADRITNVIAQSSDHIGSANSAVTNWTSFESEVEISPADDYVEDNEGYYESYDIASEEELNKYKFVDTMYLECTFENTFPFADFNVGDVLQLNGYDAIMKESINGEFKLNTISVTIEEDECTYSLDKLERIEE